MAKRRWTKLAWIAGFLVFVLCAVYMYRAFAWRDVMSTLHAANPGRFVLGVCVSFLVYWLIRTLRWQILLRAVGVRIPFIPLYFCTAITLSLALLTPAQSGEAAKVEFLKRYGLLERHPGYSTFVVERVLDLLCVTALALAGLSFYGFHLDARRAALGAATSCMVLVALALVLYASLRRHPAAAEFMAHLRASAAHPAALAAAAVLTLAAWSATSLGWQICLSSTGVAINFPKALFLTCGVTLIGLASMAPWSLGVSELSIVEILRRFGFAAVSGQAGALILRAYGLGGILLGLAHLSAWTAWRKWRHGSECR